MKILYGIQGTGNGHIMRAREVIPALQQMGVAVIKTLNLKEKPAIRHWLMTDQNINVYYPDQTALILSQIIEENVNPPSVF
ncbi:MAG: hypothetical protein IEMM0006_1478 [bacterium]|nr:MAG: hypothetical protein IEMM0006_1478 [bacterium]